MIDPSTLVSWIIGFGGITMMVYGYYTLKHAVSRAKIDEYMDILFEKVSKRYLNRDKIYDVGMDFLVSALEDDELTKVLNVKLTGLLQTATKGAVSGAMPKLKPMDMIGMLLMGYLQKSGFLGQPQQQPQQGGENPLQ